MISSTSGSSAPAGYRFPREVAVAVRWYLSYGLSYRDVEELLAERGIEVDHITVYRWVQTFTAQFINAAARPARHAVGDQWFVEDLRQGRPPVDLPRPGGRPTRPSHRCARVNPPRRGSRTKILRPCAAPRSGSGRSRDRTEHQCACAWSRSWCRRRDGTSPSGTRTTRPRPTMVASKPGCGRCADSHVRAHHLGRACVRTTLRRGHYAIIVDPGSGT
jgi:hypothetical protein